MEKTDLFIDFAAARAAYTAIRTFLEQETFDIDTSLNLDIEQGLHIAGEDTYELIGKFIKKFDLQHDGLDLSAHFLGEGEQFNSTIALTQLATLPFWAISQLLRLVTLGHLDFTRRFRMPEAGQPTTGMTFGDLLTWHLAGNYTLRKDVRIRFKEAG